MERKKYNPAAQYATTICIEEAKSKGESPYYREGDVVNYLNSEYCIINISYEKNICSYRI